MEGENRVCVDSMVQRKEKEKDLAYILYTENLEYIFGYAFAARCHSPLVCLLNKIEALCPNWSSHSDPSIVVNSPELTLRRQYPHKEMIDGFLRDEI